MSKIFKKKPALRKIETDLQTWKTNFWLPKRKEGRGKLGGWYQQILTSVHQMDDQQGPMYSTRNYIQYVAITYMEKQFEKEYIYKYICIKLNHFAIHLKLTHYVNHTSIKNKY